jgi:hypothetical protein
LVYWDEIVECDDDERAVVLRARSMVSTMPGKPHSCGRLKG